MDNVFEDPHIEIYRSHIGDDLCFVMKSKTYEAFSLFVKPKSFEDFLSQLQGAYDQLQSLIASGKAPLR